MEDTSHPLLKRGELKMNNVEKKFTQEEINLIIKKRLERAKKKWEKTSKQKLKELELENQLMRRNIPIEFSKLIKIEGKDVTNQNLNTFQNQWDILIQQAVNEHLAKIIQNAMSACMHKDKSVCGMVKDVSEDSEDSFPI